MSLGKLKAFLTLLMALGAVAYFGGDGTLASFSAETANPGSSIASGTLTMSNTVNSGTACVTTTTATNINSNCNAPLTLTNVAPGVYGGVGQITVKNTGSIDAAHLWLWAPSATDCVDAKTTTPGSTGATYGTQLNFNTGTGANGLCGYLQLYVQEVTQTTGGTTTTNSYCWFGAVSTNGMCYAPISMYIATPVAAGTVTSLTAQVSSTNTSTALDGNIKAGDKLVATTPTGAQQQFTAGASNQYMGQTTPIQVASTSTIALPAGTVITDLSTDANGPIPALNAASRSLYSVYAFDSLHPQLTGPIELTSVSSNGTLNPNTGVAELPAGATRTFYIGVFFANPTGSTQNTLQGLFSTFGLTWHIDQ